ncbi:MAG: Ig domain-containing protein [Kiritimatiellae bacterium]|nr:Ig domain-containing protein [Kiritimatiellia bacterium]MDD5519879.1 Ig domain-containing protein [Kiritimatiellia bacterium]
MLAFRMSILIFCFFFPVLRLCAAIQGLPAKPWDDLPTDRPRTQQIVVTTSPKQYEIVMDSTVDGVMTRMPVGYSAFHQGWQPNRFVRLENIGDTDVINPWLTINGKRKWRSLQELTREATGSYQTDADKARAVYEFTRQHRFHACTWDREVDDAVKVFNVYGYTLCGDDAQVIADLWKAAGLQTRRGYPVGHCVSEVFYDGDFHLMDGDEHGIYLKRDNQTVASEAEVVHDHDLMKRTHTYGILSGDSPQTDEFSASLFGYEGKREGSNGGYTRHVMAFTLRPGESIEWRWDHIGKQYSAGTVTADGKWHKDGEGDLAIWGDIFYSKMRNGRTVYQPDLTKDIARRGMMDAVGLAVPGLTGLTPVTAGKVASATWQVATAYVTVGGKVTTRFKRAGIADKISVSLSRDGKDWQTVWEAKDQTGVFPVELVLDDRLSPRAKPQYAYRVRIDMTAAVNPADVVLEKILFETDLQMAALGLPELEVGKNSVEYTDETPGLRKVSITHNWLERTAWQPPAAPVPELPADGATVDGTQVSLRWQPAGHPAGTAISDYRVQVSAFADMRWVLSPNFDKIVSKTASKEKTGWAVPFIGLLNPAVPYYWRVCAKDANGVWGPWSKVSSFLCDAPGVPILVRAIADQVGHTVTLTWEPSPGGTTPVEYRVYASDEKGFSISDVEYKVRMGRGFCRDMAEYKAREKVNEYIATPANFLAATKERTMIVAGPDLTVQNANKCFYRVVAVDKSGLRSGASEYAEAPHPFIYTKPVTRLVKGQAFDYQPRVLRSIGDLRCKDGYNAAFWNREILTFSLARAPVWMTVDSQTGHISSTPPQNAAGSHEVVLKIVNDKGSTAEQSFVLDVTPAR